MTVSVYNWNPVYDTHGKNNARINSASNGPPTMPNILRAICRIRFPKYCDRKARAIVNTGNIDNIFKHN
jgi:hypothetical protein